MAMEDNDRLSIPHVPSTVAVVGDVYNPGSFIYEARNSTGAYLEIAGKGKPQSDLHHAFVLRANGVVVAANNVNGLFEGSKFNRLRLYPGDRDRCTLQAANRSISPRAAGLDAGFLAVSIDGRGTSNTCALSLCGPTS